MKILLVVINAKYIHSNLAVYCLKAYAEAYRDNIEIAEYTINQYETDIVRDIYKRKPDVLAFSCYIWNRMHVDHIIDDICKVMPKLPIWLGGPEAYYNAAEVLREHNGSVKGVMLGEGEKIFKNLASHYVENAIQLHEIPGIMYIQENGSVQTNEPETVMDLSEVPFPYEDFDLFRNKILYYETSRGCPFSCSYCLSSVEKKLRFRDISLVKKELGIFLEHRVSQVKFVDRTFNCKKEHAMEIWKFIKEQDNGVTNFHFEIAADLIDEDELELLSTMRPGLVQFEIGVQSTNMDTVREIERVMDVEKVRYVVERINHFHNVHQHLDLIAGLPYEDYASFGRSFDDVFGMEPEQLQMGFLKVLSGSNMYLRRDNYELEYSGRPPYEVLKTRWLSYDEILKLHGIETVVELYYNSHQYDGTIGYLTRMAKSPFHFFESLGEFYERRCEQGEKHNRITRYEILLDYIEEFFGGEIEVCKELLVYDVYLRENIKSRPSFASEFDATIFRNLYRLWKEKGLQRHIEKFYYPVYEIVRGQCQEPKRMEQPYYLLFDYQCRDPLTFAASVSILSCDECQS